jgi:hypothetical protein
LQVNLLLFTKLFAACGHIYRLSSLTEYGLARDINFGFESAGLSFTISLQCYDNRTYFKIKTLHKFNQSQTVTFGLMFDCPRFSVY